VNGSSVAGLSKLRTEIPHHLGDLMPRSAVLIIGALLCAGLGPAAWSRGYGADFTDISVQATPEHETRYTSGKTIYVEALQEGTWVGIYWAADGQINFPRGQFNFPYWQHRDPAFELRIKDDPASRTAPGALVSSGWEWVSDDERPRTDRGARHFVVNLSNAGHHLRLEVHTLLDGTPVLTRWLKITNISNRPVALTELSPWSGRLWREVNPFTLGYQRTGKGDAEGISGGRIEWKSLPNGKTVVESREGNGYDDPFFILRSEAEGDSFIGHMAWTANYKMEFDCAQDASDPRAGLSFTIGPLAVNALRVIAPGETIRSPEVHLGHVAGDLDMTVHAMDDHLRQFVLPTRKPERSYLIEYSVPRDYGFLTADAFDEPHLLKAIDLAAAVGAQLFIIDYGWWDVYGEWVPSPRRFPHGLKPLVDYAHKKGMLFGLYAEVEGGRGNWSQSKLFKEHPDWFTPQNVLRLDQPEVAAYLESELLQILDKYKPDLYRQDFIPVPLFTYEGPSAPHDGFVENSYWRYYDAYYHMWERVHEKYPDLILQMCSNGGAREDLAMLQHFHETYTNEGDLATILASYSGKTLSLPAEILEFGLHKCGPLDTCLRATFALSTPWILAGPAPNVEELSPERRERFLHYAGLYKNFIRPLFPAVKVYHHAPVSARGGYSSSPWFAMEFTSPDRSKGWATIVRLRDSDSDIYRLWPRGLDPAKTYRVTFDSLGSAATVGGLRLIEEGLPIRLESVLSSELLLFEAQ
jgi:alpha-galactosidase